MWDKRNKEPNDIKKFMSEYLRNILLNKEEPSKYQKGITHITLDVLDSYAEFATNILLKEIYFYEKFHPELLIKKGFIFDCISDKKTEYYIPIEINVSLDNINYYENINWDLLDYDLIPEKFAENIVKDEYLPNKFIFPIAYQIRKGIHYYVYELFQNIAKNFEKYGQENYLGDEKLNKTTRYSEDIKKNIPIFILDGKLSHMLGKKRKVCQSMNEEDLPSFLVNKKNDNKNDKISCEKKKNKKILNSSSKKILDIKNKITNQIEHDKQSTTMEENE